MSGLSSEIDSAVDSASAAAESTPSSVETAPASGESASASPAAVAPVATSPVATPPGTPQKAAKTTPATIPAATLEDAEPTGPIPLERHRAILANARTKAEAEATQRIRQDFEQTYGYDRERFQELRPAFQMLDERSPNYNPLVFHQRLTQQLEQRGLIAPQTAQPTAPATPAPAADIQSLFRSDPARYLRQTEDGTIVVTAEGMMAADQWQRQQRQRELDERFKPVEQLRQQAEAESAKATGIRQANQMIAEAQQWQGFNELKADIHALMLKDGRVTLESAYARVYREKYVPMLKQQARETVLSEMNARTTTTPDVAPSASRGAVRPGRAAKGDAVWDQAFTKALAEATQ